jgi:hypothetical protein
VKVLPQSEESAAEGLDELDDAEEAEVVAAVVAPLVVEEHQPAPGRRKPRGDDEGGSPGE